MHGEHWVNEAIQEADLLIALGMRFDDRVTGKLASYAPHAKKIHIDIDPSELHKNVRADVAIAGDLKTVLRDWLPLVAVDPSRCVDHAHRRARRRADGPRHRGAAGQRPALRRARDSRHLEGHRRPRHHRHRRRPAPDVGGAVLQGRRARDVHHLGRPRHDGLRHARGDRRQDGAPRPRSVGHRRRRRLPDDAGRAADDGAGERQGQRRDHQQRLPRDGAAVAAVLPRSPLLGDADVVARLRQARRRARPAGRSRHAAGRHGRRAASTRAPRPARW